MGIKGAEIFIRCLKAEGVEIVFGFPGGAVLDIYDEIYKSKFPHIMVRHEQGAIHAADGYARASGKVGVCLVTSGPGATNTVTGIATAYMDSSPLVVFTGQVPTPLIGNDAFQEADIVGITRPCTKHNYLVNDINDLAPIIKEAFYLAHTGRPGPVLVDLPKDMIQTQADFHYPEEVRTNYNPVYKGHAGQISRALAHMLKAERPVFFIGGGVIHSGATEELMDLARRLSIPVTMTLMGLGAFPGDDPLSLGMLGMHGTYWANMAVTECDLLIAVGARFDDRVTGKIEAFAPHAEVIHLDIDPTSISKNVRVDIPIVGDARLTLQDFIKLLDKKNGEIKPPDRTPWLNRIDEWKRQYPLSYDQSPDGKLKPQYVIEKIHEICNGEAIITTEVGQNQMWTAQFYRFQKPRTLITSGGLGTMGFGFPAALGAQVAFPNRTVIDIAGDGSIQMNSQELATAVQYNLPVKVAILNNQYLGMVRQWQELFYGGRFSSTGMHCSPDFVKLAEAYGAVGLRAAKPQEVEPVLKEALRINKPVLIDFVVDPMENVYPMVPAGSPISEMLLV